MNEAQVNGTQAGEAQVNRTQADEAVVDGAQEDEAVADDTLDDDTLADGDGSDGPDVEKLRRLRLSGFLRELVREEGKRGGGGAAGRGNYKHPGRGPRSRARSRGAWAMRWSGCWGRATTPKWPGSGSVLMRWRAAWRRWRRSCGAASLRFGLRL